ESGVFRIRESSTSPGKSSHQIADNSRRVLRVSGSPPKATLLEEGQDDLEIAELGLTDSVEYALFADVFVLISGNRLAHFRDGIFHVQELPALVVAQPLYNEKEQMLTLLLNDGSIRKCSTQGDKFSFVCNLAGTPTTAPLKIGDRIFYGTEGRYLCFD